MREPAGRSIALQVGLIVGASAGVGWAAVLGFALHFSLGPFMGIGVVWMRFHFFVGLGVAIAAIVGLIVARRLSERRPIP